MHTEGFLAPETTEAAREKYDAMGPAAQTVVREVTKRMDFDREEYADRVTGDVVETARDALFASLLRVHVGTDEEFESWCDSHPEYERHVEGSDNVEHVVWHAVDHDSSVVAATFQKQEDAAVATLRRIAFGRFYRPALEG
ncbi:DUF5809 family protein [Halomarina litorea]|uniref:DUF5809 family protein n=1 Tax=Halomarina litorea TaxID=2961595 RepID=UPI0020C580D0|nr:DUF5809 family protein [Halomarina sp. BCD28]